MEGSAPSSTNVSSALSRSFSSTVSAIATTARITATGTTSLPVFGKTASGVAKGRRTRMRRRACSFSRLKGVSRARELCDLNTGGSVDGRKRVVEVHGGEGRGHTG